MGPKKGERIKSKKLYCPIKREREKRKKKSSHALSKTR